MKRADKNKGTTKSTDISEIEKLVDETIEAPVDTIEDVQNNIPTEFEENLENLEEGLEDQETPKVKEPVKVLEAPVKTVEVISEAAQDGLVWWKNNGGTFRIGSKRIIKPGEKFQAYPHEVSKAFRDVIVPIHRTKEDFVIVKPVMPVYKLQPNEKDGFFDIVNEQGKILNEIPLEESVANNLISDLLR